MVPSFVIPFRLVHLSGTRFFGTLWPTIAYSVIMAFVAGTWRVALWHAGVQNSVLELATTVILGGATYIALILWRHPPVVDEFSAVLLNSTHPALRAVARLV